MVSKKSNVTKRPKVISTKSKSLKKVPKKKIVSGKKGGGARRKVGIKTVKRRGHVDAYKAPNFKSSAKASAAKSSSSNCVTTWVTS